MLASSLLSQINLSMDALDSAPVGAVILLFYLFELTAVIFQDIALLEHS